MYHIRPDYQHRRSVEYFDDSVLADQWQDEVYQYARQVYQLRGHSSVVDFGCGSGFKLIKYFSDAAQVLGVDLEPTVEFLRSRYPALEWRTTLSGYAPDVGIFIAADVIEHMENPDQLLDIIQKSRARDIVISTPDRSLTVAQWGHPELGPTPNHHHYREWNMAEFYQYISSRFDVITHMTSNQAQCTQLIHARLKN